MTKREEVIKTAANGGFVNTDGAWCMASNPAKFRAYLEHIGFEVVECKETRNSTAIAITADGIRICYNGYCSNI